MQNFGKAALRVTKNYTKGYSDTQAKVREATSNDPWGPSGTQMNEIAQLTYNQNDFIEIMEMLDKRLNDKGKNWRHVFKSLTVLDYLLHQGSENVVIYFRDNIYIIKTLKEFVFTDEEGKDQGANVRQKAKDITNLLQDEDRLREERRSRASMRDRMIRGVGGNYDGDEPEDENAARRREREGGGGPNDRRGNGRAETDELKKAIEESKKSLAQEVKKREEDELKEALRLSEQEELKRQQDVDSSNAQSLFDDQSSLSSPYPRADPTPYAVGLQPQMTSLQPQFTAVPMQPQFTSFNPYQQQAEQEAAQAEFLRQQQLFMMQQQQAQQQQAQQEEWMRQQMMQQQQMQQQQAFQQQQMTGLFPQQQQPQIAVQPTGFGSNNPFAPSPSPSSFSQNNTSPSRGTTPSFNLQGTYDNHNPSNLSSLSSSYNNGRPQSTSPSPSNANVSANPYTGKQINVKTKKQLGENEQQLEHLFANRDDGQDTFGNVGALRYGYTDAGRAMVSTQKTGNNPFARQGQQQQQQNNDKPFFDI